MSAPSVLARRAKEACIHVLAIIKTLFRKYQRDNGNIIVSSISFYILLTFIPFTLLAIYILGHVIDLSNPSMHLEKYLRNILPDPYNAIIVRRVIRELNFISLTKSLSGPLGLLFLYFFASRLFAVVRPSFRIIFGRHSKGFIRGKGEELFLTLVFALVQALIFFSAIFSIVIKSALIQALPGFISKTFFAYAFGLTEIAIIFVQFVFLYYFLTPVRKKGIIAVSALAATFCWHIGRYFFQDFIIYLTKVTTFFGTYGIFIALLFWVYFSAFIFVLFAELLAILANPVSHGPEPSSHLSSGLPSKTRTKGSRPPSLHGQALP